jgi:hypothetical protein
VVARTCAMLVAVLLVVGSGDLGCSSSPGSDSGGDAGDAAADAAVPYDGPFNVPDGHPTTVQLSGCGGPGYAANFAIGSGTFQLTVDTGSGTLAVASNACTNCDVSKVFTPGTGAVDQDAQTSDNYQKGSWTGEVYSDSVKLVGQGTAVKMDFAAIDSQTAFFMDAGCAFGAMPFAPQGIVGFGPSGLAKQGTQDFLTKLTATGAVPDIFAVELCSSGGQLMVGGVDPAKGALSGPVVYTPLTSSSYYTVSLTDLQLSGVSLGYGESDFGTTAVDTGTSVLALPPAVFMSLVSKLESNATFATAFPVDGGTTWLGTTDCFSSPSFSRTQLDSELPAMTLSFPGTGGGSSSLTLKATDSYLTPTVSSGTTYYCSGIYENTTATEASTILGTSVMSGHLVLFDVANSRLGFAPQTFCP